MFLRYLGKLGTIAELALGNGRTYQASAANLLPTSAHMERERGLADLAEMVSTGLSEQSYTWGASSATTGGPPPGVRIVPTPGAV